MKLYTICVADRPLVVMATGDWPTGNYPDALGQFWVVTERRDMPLAGALREVEEALATWLGQDLQADGLWDGDLEVVQIREATAEEAECWRVSLQHGIAGGHQEAGDGVAYLPPPPSP